MDWKHYQGRYYEFRRRTSYVRLLGLITREATSSFPDHLPESVRVPFLESYAGAGKKAREYLAHLVPGGPHPLLDFDEIAPQDPAARRIWSVAIELFLQSAISFDQDDSPRLHYASYAQEHVQQVALFDAIVTDSLRASCFRVPRIAACMKPKERENPESFLHRCSFRPIAERIAYIVEGSQPTPRHSNASLVALSSAWEVRNLIMHRGGRVDGKFADRTGIRTVRVGDQWAFDDQGLVDLLSMIRTIGHDLFLRVAMLAFGVDERRAIQV